MGLFGFRREVHLFGADSRRSAGEAADEADDTASVDSRTANAQGLYLRFILYNNELMKRQIEPNESNRSPTTRFKSANAYMYLSFSMSLAWEERGRSSGFAFDSIHRVVWHVLQKLKLQT